MNRENFNAIIRRELDKQDTTQNSFAARLGVTPATLRTWLTRNKYPKLAIVKILKELKLELTEAAAHEVYEIGVARPTQNSRLYEAGSLRSAYVTADREREKAAFAMAPMVKSIESLCSAVGKNDLVIVLTSTVTPWEMEQTIGRPMREAIVQGISNGGTFLYLRAKSELVETYKHPWGFDRLRSEDMCKEEMETFREAIAAGLKTKEGGIDSPDAEQLVYRATPQYFVRGDLPFFTPGFTILMFRAGDYPGGEEDRMAIRLPDNAWATVYLTRSDYFRDRFRRSVCLALEDQEKEHKEQRQKLIEEKQKRRGQAVPSAKFEDKLIIDENVLKRIKRMLEA